MSVCRRAVLGLLKTKGAWKLWMPEKLARCSSLHTTQHVSSEQPFSRFPVPAVDSLPEDLRLRLREVEEKTGFMPNVFSTLSYRPAELRAFINYYDALMDERGSLTKADKEMIVVATSAENSCLYCIVAHGALHRIFSKNQILADQLAANWRVADLDDRQRAILDFAIDVCHCRPIADEKFQALRNHGMSEDDIWDIGAIAAFFAMSNRMAYLTNMKPNAEFHLMGRVKREKKEDGKSK